MGVVEDLLDLEHVVLVPYVSGRLAFRLRESGEVDVFAAVAAEIVDVLFLGMFVALRFQVSQSPSGFRFLLVPDPRDLDEQDVRRGDDS